MESRREGIVISGALGAQRFQGSSELTHQLLIEERFTWPVCAVLVDASSHNILWTAAISKVLAPQGIAELCGCYRVIAIPQRACNPVLGGFGTTRCSIHLREVDSPFS